MRVSCLIVAALFSISLAARPARAEPNRLALQYGAYINQPAGTADRLIAPQIRYSRELTSGLLLTDSSPDFIALDLAAGWYELVDVAFNSDYSVLPLTFSVQYGLGLGDAFSAFVYGGVRKPVIMSAEGSESSSISEIRGAVGVGGTWSFAQGWHIRADAGLDQLMAGIGAAL